MEQLCWLELERKQQTERRNTSENKKRKSRKEEAANSHGAKKTKTKNMSDLTKGVFVSNVSASADQKTVNDFFSFCGKITSLSLQPYVAFPK
jgi:RNA recognition motif-containing protein